MTTSNALPISFAELTKKNLQQQHATKKNASPEEPPSSKAVLSHAMPKEDPSAIVTREEGTQVGSPVETAEEEKRDVETQAPSRSLSPFKSQAWAQQTEEEFSQQEQQQKEAAPPAGPTEDNEDGFEPVTSRSQQRARKLQLQQQQQQLAAQQRRQQRQREQREARDVPISSEDVRTEKVRAGSAPTSPTHHSRHRDEKMDRSWRIREEPSDAKKPTDAPVEEAPASAPTVEEPKKVEAAPPPAVNVWQMRQKQMQAKSSETLAEPPAVAKKEAEVAPQETVTAGPSSSAERELKEEAPKKVWQQPKEVESAKVSTESSIVWPTLSEHLEAAEQQQQQQQAAKVETSNASETSGDDKSNKKVSKAKWVALPVTFQIASSSTATTGNAKKERKANLAGSRVSAGTMTSPSDARNAKTSTGTAGTNTMAPKKTADKKPTDATEVKESKVLAAGERRRSLSMPSTPGHNPAAAPYTPSLPASLPPKPVMPAKVNASKTTAVSTSTSSQSSSGGRKGRSTQHAFASGDVPTYRYDPNSYDETFLAQCVLAQVEYYFSPENLCKDIFFRMQMNDNGFVPLATIAKFNRVRHLTNDLSFISECLDYSSVLCKDPTHTLVRRAFEWKQWIIPPPQREEWFARHPSNANVFSTPSLTATLNTPHSAATAAGATSVSMPSSPVHHANRKTDVVGGLVGVPNQTAYSNAPASDVNETTEEEVESGDVQSPSGDNASAAPFVPKQGVAV